MRYGDEMVSTGMIGYRMRVDMISLKNQTTIDAETLSEFTFEDAMSFVGAPVEELV